jgi:hypothetical protein
MSKLSLSSNHPKRLGPVNFDHISKEQQLTLLRHYWGYLQIEDLYLTEGNFTEDRRILLGWHKEGANCENQIEGAQQKSFEPRRFPIQADERVQTCHQAKYHDFE